MGTPFVLYDTTVKCRVDSPYLFGARGLCSLAMVACRAAAACKLYCLARIQLFGGSIVIQPLPF